MLLIHCGASQQDKETTHLSELTRTRQAGNVTLEVGDECDIGVDKDIRHSFTGQVSETSGETSGRGRPSCNGVLLIDSATAAGSDCMPESSMTVSISIQQVIDEGTREAVKLGS